MSKEAEMLAERIERKSGPQFYYGFSDAERALIAASLRAAARPSPDAGLGEREAIDLRECLKADWRRQIEAGLMSNASIEMIVDLAEMNGLFDGNALSHRGANVAGEAVGRDWVADVFKPLPLDETKMLHDILGCPTCDGEGEIDGHAGSIPCPDCATPSPAGRDPATIEAPLASGLYRVVAVEGGFEPQHSYTAGKVSGFFWYPLNAEGYWLEPEAYNDGRLTHHVSMSESEAQRAILRARAINQEHVALAASAVVTEDG